jgi:uncharacterized protein YcbK (DUF882 family)
MAVGKYFSVEELTRSAEAEKNEIDNTPNAEQRRNLEKLIVNVLDPLRFEFGAPIYVNSGFRCSELNSLVGGVSTSQHLRGCAADIVTGTKSGNKRLFNLAASLSIPFDQLIDERGYSWIHISYVEPIQRRQILHK